MPHRPTRSPVRLKLLGLARRSATRVSRRLRRGLAPGLCVGAVLASAAGGLAQTRTPAQPISMKGRVTNANRQPGQYYCPPAPGCPTYPYPNSPNFTPYYEGAPQRSPAPGRAPSDRAGRSPGMSDAAPNAAPGTSPSDAAPNAPTAPSDATSPTPDTAANAPTTAQSAPAESFSSASGATGTASSPASASPAMVGDFFGASQQVTIKLTGLAFDSHFGSGGVASVLDPSESVAGRVKQAESYSPLPADRVFLDYVAYHNVPIGVGIGGAPRNIDVQRYTPGLERTFQDGLFSVEVRMPVALTQNSTTDVTNGATDADRLEAGNLNVAIKSLLWQSDALAFTGGLGVRTPTANDLTFRGGDTVIEADNQAVHLLPFFGMLVNANETFFAMAMLQVDVDVNGNPIYLDNGNGFTFQGRLQDQTFLYDSFQVGAWLYDQPASGSLRSVALTTEFHHSASVSDPDMINNASGLMIFEGSSSSGGGGIGGGGNGNGNGDDSTDFNAFTGVLGIHFFYAGGARVTFAYGVPLGGDRFADGEFRTLLNRYY